MPLQNRATKRRTILPRLSIISLDLFPFPVTAIYPDHPIPLCPTLPDSTSSHSTDSTPLASNLTSPPHHRSTAPAIHKPPTSTGYPFDHRHPTPSPWPKNQKGTCSYTSHLFTPHHTNSYIEPKYDNRKCPKQPTQSPFYVKNDISKKIRKNQKKTKKCIVQTLFGC